MGVGRAEEWAAGRKRKKEEGGSRGRKRGRGAQLRRQLTKMRNTMDEWRRQQTGCVQPGDTRAVSQRYGCTRLLVQLTKVKMELAAASRQKAATEVQLEVMRKEVEVLRTWYKSQEAKDMRRLEYLLHEAKMQVQGERRRREAAELEVGSMWEVLDGNQHLHDKDAAEWAAEKLRLQAEMEAATGAAEKQAAMVGDAAEACAGTDRKAVARPPAAGGLPPKQLKYGVEEPVEEVIITIPDAPRAKDGTLKVRFAWDERQIETTVAAHFKAGAKLRVTIPRRQVTEDAEQGAARRQLAREGEEHGAAQRGKMLAEEFISWDEMSDRWHEAMNELHELQRWMAARYPDAEDAWLEHCGKGRKKKKSSGRG